MIINNYNEIAALGLKLVDNDNEREINKFSFRLSTACVCVCVGVCENLFLTKESRAELVECNKIEFQGIFSPIKFSDFRLHAILFEGAPGNFQSAARNYWRAVCAKSPRFIVFPRTKFTVNGRTENIESLALDSFCSTEFKTEQKLLQRTHLEVNFIITT